ncbi:hypothetical protein N9235_00145 [Gammaproteobacteria bacterium]|nr:hypothetical protein [Gammaproteobacteria bacterium]
MTKQATVSERPVRASLVTFLLLALTVFLNGAHTGPYFYLLGRFLEVMTVSTAYIEQYIWFILLAAVITMVVAI